MRSCSLSKRSLTAGPYQSTGISDSRPSLFKAEITNKAACHVFGIFHTKRDEYEKKIELENYILDFFFETLYHKNEWSRLQLFHQQNATSIKFHPGPSPLPSLVHKWNYKIKKELERSEKRKLTSTWEYWKRTLLNKQKWKKNLKRARKHLEAKLYSRNHIKGENIWVVPLVRYSESFLKWTMEEFQQIDQRTKKNWWRYTKPKTRQMS